MEYLKSRRNKEIIDIEDILWVIEDIRNFMSTIGNSDESFVNYAFKQGFIAGYTPGHSEGNIKSISYNLCLDCTTLIEEINSLVYQMYGYEPSYKEIEYNWSYLLQRIIPLGKLVSIFTTNYDAVIESALNIMFPIDQVKSIRGISGGIRQKLDFSKWDAASSSEDLLTKLHGSIDWKVSGDDVFVGDPVFTGDHTKHLIVYPGFKGSDPGSIFSTFHSYLADRLAECDSAIFIGFAFRDEYINSIISNNTSASQQIFVLNPDKSVRFPSRRSIPIYIHENFDSKSIEKLLGKWTT